MDRRSRVTSRKLTHFLFASMVNLRLWPPNTLQMCFLIPSNSFGGLLSATKPSSLLRPISLPHTGVILNGRKESTSSHVSATSKLVACQTCTTSLTAHNKSVLARQTQP